VDSHATDIIVVVGEQSGDLLGESLVKDLLSQNPSLRILAVSGPRMRKFPIEEIFPMENLQVMGFVDVFCALPKIIRLFFRLRKEILQRKPKAVVFIDYPGFNLRLAKSLRKKNYCGILCHYVCPSVWAWGKKRIDLIEKTHDLLLTLFPFEKQFFHKTSLQVECVGHPLTTFIAPSSLPRQNILAIFPGSRVAEIEKNLPLQLAVARKLKTLDPTLSIAVSIAHIEKAPLICKLSENTDCQLISPEQSYTLMQTAKLALATSGTVTLELALHQTPTIVQYALSLLEVFLAQKLFRMNLPFYALPNIIAGKEVFPEFLGPNLTEQNIVNAAQTLQAPIDIRPLLTEKQGSVEAATLILQRIQKQVE
jgi:lipid-A-disaccharide synthase